MLKPKIIPPAHYFHPHSFIPVGFGGLCSSRCCQLKSKGLGNRLSFCPALKSRALGGTGAQATECQLQKEEKGVTGTKMPGFKSHLPGTSGVSFIIYITPCFSFSIFLKKAILIIAFLHVAPWRILERQQLLALLNSQELEAHRFSSHPGRAAGLDCRVHRKPDSYQR